MNQENEALLVGYENRERAYRDFLRNLRRKVLEVLDGMNFTPKSIFVSAGPKYDAAGNSIGGLIEIRISLPENPIAL